ncbi:MAG: hypothetical protein Alpg2KO_06460 [Alphaproteobacteria bacterium]
MAEKSGKPRGAYHHGDLRAHLIETVRQLVEEKGAEGFSISQAARQASVSSAAPYKHFADKDEIIHAVVQEGFDRLRHCTDKAATAAESGDVDKVAAVGLAYVAFARREPGVFRLMFGLTAKHKQDPALMASGHAAYDVLIREVTAALPKGSTEDNIRSCAYMLWSFVHGHAFLQIDDKVDVAAVQSSEMQIVTEATRRILQL